MQCTAHSARSVKGVFDDLPSFVCWWVLVAGCRWTRLPRKSVGPKGAPLLTWRAGLPIWPGATQRGPVFVDAPKLPHIVARLLGFGGIDDLECSGISYLQGHYSGTEDRP